MKLQFGQGQKVLAFLLAALIFDVSWAHTPLDFAKKPAFRKVKISPDGKHFSTIVMQNEKASLAVFDASSFKVVGGVVLPGRNEVLDCFWATNKRLVIKVGKKKAWERRPGYYGELFAINLDGKKGKMIYGYRSGHLQTGTQIRQKAPDYGWAELVDILPEDKNHILISSTNWRNNKKRFSKLQKLNINTGKMRRVASSPIPGGNFVLDNHGNLKLVYGIDEERNKLVYLYDKDKDKKWSALPTQQYGDAFKPYSVTPDGDGLFVLDNYQSDKTGLFKMSLTSGKLEKIYAHKEVDITDVIVSTDFKTTYALKVDPGYPTYLLLNKQHEEAKLFKQLLATFSGRAINITSHTESGDKWVIHAVSDTSPGTYYLYDKKKNNLTLLFKRFPHLDEKKLAKNQPVSFTTSDNLKISGYLTRPLDVDEATQTPLVVLAHGGPHGPRDFWRYSSKVQLLASQGYSVLRVNFRGSGGYGYTFKEAGYRHWGDHMMRDIIEGTEWAVAQGNIDSERICIMGASFGGYAAVQASTLAPDLFKCAITNVGVSNLKLMDKSDIPDWYAGESYLEEVLGTDEAQLEDFSPVNHVEKLKGPVLIAHGKKDKRVPFVNAKQLEKALKKNGKDFETLYISGEKHGFYSDKNRAKYFETVVSFLKKNI